MDHRSKLRIGVFVGCIKLNSSDAAKLSRSHINSFSLLLHTTSVILLPFNQPDPHWSSSLVTLFHPPVQSNLKITKRSFLHAASHLWNKLPPSLRIPSTGSIPSFSNLHHGPVCHLSYGAFHSRLKTHLFFKSFPP